MILPMICVLKCCICMLYRLLVREPGIINMNLSKKVLQQGSWLFCLGAWREHNWDPGCVSQRDQIESLRFLRIRSQFFVYLGLILSMSVSPLMQPPKYHIHLASKVLFPPIGCPRLPSRDVALEPLTNPIILIGPCVTVALLDHINITLIEADRPAEPGENQQRAEGFYKVWGPWCTCGGHIDRCIQQCWHFYQRSST